MEKFNEELIRKELLNLSKEAIDETIKRLRENNIFEFSEDDNDGEGNNMLEVRVMIRNVDNKIGCLFNDFYTKKQLVPERPYGKTISPLKLSEENRNVELEEPSRSVSEENNIRRIVRDEMHKVLRREHLQK